MYYQWFRSQRVSRYTRIEKITLEAFSGKIHPFGMCMASQGAVGLCGEKGNITYGSYSQSHLLCEQISSVNDMTWRCWRKELAHVQHIFAARRRTE